MREAQMASRAPASAVLALLLAACQGGAEREPAPAAPAGEVLVSGRFSMVLPLGLQAGAAYVPEGGQLSEARIELGRRLFFDPRLSRDGSISCATCHAPERGFSDGSRVSTGIGGQMGGRNAPTVINRLFSVEQFWDGRAADLEEQALGPIQNPIEMGNTLQGMVSALARIEAYPYLFQAAFGSPGVTAERVARAIAAYERSLLAGNAPYDRYRAGARDAMGQPAVRGMRIFNDPQRGNCVTCHAGFNFTDESFHNLGVGMDGPTPDLGRYVVTKDDGDRGAFKTPTLRNVARSAPYMHDGSEATLRDVVEFYDRGGVKNPWLSEEIRPLNLSEQDKADLVAFLESLTGEVRGAERPELP
ncbi:MAG: cytochrome-c peroxidase [Acidobacteriota bacterium]